MMRIIDRITKDGACYWSKTESSGKMLQRAMRKRQGKNDDISFRYQKMMITCQVYYNENSFGD